MPVLADWQLYHTASRVVAERVHKELHGHRPKLAVTVRGAARRVRDRAMPYSSLERGAIRNGMADTGVEAS